MYDETDNSDLDLETAIAEHRRRIKERAEQVQSNDLSPIGKALTALATGWSAGISGGNGADEYRKHMAARDANMKSRLAALDDKGELSAITSLAKMKQERELLPQKMRLQLENQMALARAAGGKQETLLRMRQAFEDSQRTRSDSTTRRGQDLNYDKAVKAAKGKSGPVSVYGYELLDGAMPTDDDLKKVKSSSAAYSKFNIAMNSLRDVIKTHGVRSMPYSEGRKQIEKAASNVVIEGKEAANLGALAGPDMDLILAAIGDPTSAGTAYLGNAGYLKVLESARKDSEVRHDATVRAYGFRRSGAGAGGPAPRAQRQVDGVTYEKNPTDGKWYEVK